MNIFDRLIELIEPLKNDIYGHWVIDTEHKGTADDPKHFPYLEYSPIVYELIERIYTFQKENKEFDLTNYNKILKKRGLKDDIKSLENADIKKMDQQGIMAMLMSIVRAERFQDGVILGFCKSGIIVKWLERLKEISN